MIKKIIASTIFFALFWLAVLGLSGSLFSGFHFTDDHQIIGFSRSIESAGFIDQAIDYISGDISLKGRFLPLYDLHRLIEVKLFGTDFFMWAVYGWLLATIASSCFAAYLLMTGFSLAEALLFPLLLFLGFQAGVWWRFGTAETIGMPLLSFMLIVSAIAAKRPSAVLDVIFVVLGVMLMLSKEAFILFIPAAVFLRIWTHQMINDSGWARAALASLVPGIVLLALAGADIIFIKFFVGTTGMGYAGYEGFSAGPFITALVNYLYASHAWLALAGLVLFMAEKPGSRGYGALLPVFFFFCLALLPQALLHAKSGAGERYLLPGVIGPVFTVAALMRLMRESLRPEGRASFRRSLVLWACALAVVVFLGSYMMKSSKFMITFTLENLTLLSDVEQIPSVSYFAAWVHKWVRLLFPWPLVALAAVSVIVVKAGRGAPRVLSRSFFLGVAALFGVLLSFSVTFDNAFHSAFQGRMTNAWLDSIKENTAKGDAILVVADPAMNNEWALALKTYLNIETGRQNLYAYPVLTKPSYTPFEKTLIDSFGSIYAGRGLAQLRAPDDVKAVVIFPEAEDAFLGSSADWFNASYYKKYVNMYGFVSYYRLQ